MKYLVIILTLVIIFNSIFYIGANKPCAPRNEKYGIVCVCNSTYCDEISKIEKLEPGSYMMYSSSADGLRFRKSIGELEKSKIMYDGHVSIQWISDLLERWNITNNSVILTFDKSRQYQTIQGFGGGFSDAASGLYHQFSKETQQKIVMSYFSENGIEYNMGRIPIGGADVSTRPYTYNDYPADDFELSNFRLSFEDYEYKIPFIKDAQKLATDEILLMASAWSPPVWMKTNKNFIYGKLLPEYYQVWADYHVRFLEEYKKLGLSLWAITPGNQPLNGFLHVTPMNSMGWFPHEQAEWIRDHFGPTIKSSNFSDVKILALDDQRANLFIWMEFMSKTPKSLEYIDGIATHIYTNQYVPAYIVEFTRNAFPDKFFISNEGSFGSMDRIHVQPGSWDRAENYIKYILEDLNLGYVAWLDWNLMLDEKGGPNWCNNAIDSSILATPNKDEFIKQPYFYALGHFSKFIPRGSKRIHVDQYKGPSIGNVAFLRPDGGIVVVFYNSLQRELKITVGGKSEGSLSMYVPPRSIHTIIFW